MNMYNRFFFFSFLTFNLIVSLKNNFINGSVLPQEKAQEKELVVEGAETLRDVRDQVLKLTLEIENALLQNENGHIQIILKTLNTIRSFVADKTAHFLKEADVFVTENEVLLKLESKKIIEENLQSFNVTNFTKNEISLNNRDAQHNESELYNTHLKEQNSNIEQSKEDYEPDSNLDGINYDYNNDENEEPAKKNFSKESKAFFQSPENPNFRFSRLTRDLTKRDHDSNSNRINRVVRPITSFIRFPFSKNKK